MWRTLAALALSAVVPASASTAGLTPEELADRALARRTKGSSARQPSPTPWKDIGVDTAVVKQATLLFREPSSRSEKISPLKKGDLTTLCRERSVMAGCE